MQPLGQSVTENKRRPTEMKRVPSLAAVENICLRGLLKKNVTP